MKIDRSELPFFFSDYITHLTAVKALSDSTVMGYFRDIRQFLRFVRFEAENPGQNPDAALLPEIPIHDMTVEELRRITLRTIINYYNFIIMECGNKERIRARKASALRSFFKYLQKQARLIDENPTESLEIRSPNPRKQKPKYLNLNDSLTLLRTLTEQKDKLTHLRDYCIITLFLNCGIRLSELVGLNLSSIDFIENKMLVLGKGSVQRTVYLNEACMSALREYLFERTEVPTDDKALFLSTRKQRISKRRVQQIVDNALTAAGLDGRGLSTHKLRHPAATLMYQHGHVDLLTLQKILGHVSISTTEIYTHLTDVQMQEAMDHSPLAGIKRKELK